MDEQLLKNLPLQQPLQMIQPSNFTPIKFGSVVFVVYLQATDWTSKSIPVGGMSEHDSFMMGTTDEYHTLPNVGSSLESSVMYYLMHKGS